MPKAAIFLHDHPNFTDLIRQVGQAQRVASYLVEKDYWLMHSLWGLQQQGWTFQLKGGTSLSKGHRIIQRFSEDIDLRIEPPAGHDVKAGRNQEVGFDDTTPNSPCTITSWALDAALQSTVKVIDNRALSVPCYSPAYTFVEKLQTISTKFRQQQNAEVFPKNFLRHYYDLYCLLDNAEVQAFIGTAAYRARKKERFRAGDNLHIASNEAFVLTDFSVRALYDAKYRETAALYYAGQVPFQSILERFAQHLARMC